MKFLKNISFFAMGMERILTETKEIKKRIQHVIEQGLENDTIKPFDRCILTGACTEIQALETLK